MPHGSRRTATLGVLAGGALLMGCSIIYGHLKTENCSTDADCVARDPSRFAGYRCDPADFICKGPDAGVDGSTPVIACNTNAECQTQLADDKSICAPTSPRLCQHLEAAGCTYLATESTGTPPVYKDENGVFVAMVENTTGEGETQRFSVAQMALNEINNTTGGLRPLGNGQPQPLGLLMCPYGDDTIAATMAHLKELGIRGVVGPGVSAQFVTVARTYAIPNDQFFLMGSTPASPSIEQLNDPSNLVWDVTPSQTVQAPAIRALVAEAETQVRTAYGLAATTDIRLVIAYEDSEFGSFLLSAVRDGLKFNNNGHSTATDTTNYREFKYPADVTTTAIGGDAGTSSALVEVNAFNPAIVIVLGNPNAQTVVQVIERQLPTNDGPNAPRPHYIANGYAVDENQYPTQFSTPEARARFRGVLNPSRGPAFDGYAIRYNSRFNAPTLEEYATVYDATYLVAYGIQAAQSTGATVDATRIATALARVGQTPTSAGVLASIQVGPGSDGSNITNSLSLLAGNASQLDIVGASSQLSFDSRGVPEPNSVTTAEYCLRADRHYIQSGRTFVLSTDGTTGTWSGTASCP